VCVARTSISYRCVLCHPWCTHRTSLVVKKKPFQFSCGCEQFNYGRSFGFLVINDWDEGEHYETPCTFSYNRGSANYQRHLSFYTYEEVTSAINREEFLVNMSCIILRSLLWLYSSLDKNRNTKDRVSSTQHQIFNQFPMCHIKILLGRIRQKGYF
jgi:hypothetical protein